MQIVFFVHEEASYSYFLRSMSGENFRVEQIKSAKIVLGLLTEDNLFYIQNIYIYNQSWAPFLYNTTITYLAVSLAAGEKNY